ncbi:hypothetical protein IAI10_16705 [Clostridium sp. 19966]|uniref:hypothetical protein n=1 Tax=Clostridium sp. 19966 TaxID=2768166 RepID=UPI0028E03FA5|nr:hypothetical protein [Clostridium sp. 19966]MDT8718310.1 hypothetical protein [Clostridium sp. 19966]
MRLNNRQKSLLIQVLSEEWSKASWAEFNLSMEDRKTRSKDFSKHFSNNEKR